MVARVSHTAYIPYQEQQEPKITDLLPQQILDAVGGSIDLFEKTPCPCEDATKLHKIARNWVEPHKPPKQPTIKWGYTNKWSTHQNPLKHYPFLQLQTPNSSPLFFFTYPTEDTNLLKDLDFWNICYREDSISVRCKGSEEKILTFLARFAKGEIREMPESILSWCGVKPKNR
jgi:hypothetical protein